MVVEKIRLFLALLAILVFSVSCVNAGIETGKIFVGTVWDAKFESVACKYPGDGSILYDGLTEMGLNDNLFRFQGNELLKSDYYAAGVLSDEFKLAWFDDVWKNPSRAGCFNKNTASELDYYLEQAHPVADILSYAALLSGDNIYGIEPYIKGNLPGDFNKAINAICDSAGGCGEVSGDIPEELKIAITPLLWSIFGGMEARKKMDGELQGNHDPEWWFNYGGGIIIKNTADQEPDLLNSDDRSYLLGAGGGRKDLYKSAAGIAFSIENIRWEAFWNMENVEYSLKTEAGWILIRDSTNHKYWDEGRDLLLVIDLGGDDQYLEPMGANESAKNSVSIAIDLSGNDFYGYEEFGTAYDREGLPPSDKFGRFSGNTRLGNVSMSDECRQGAGRNGIGMLFDMGSGNDSYQSLRCSQGYAHIGVGVQLDQGGDNIFTSESASQGFAQFGIGLHITSGDGNDKRSSFSYSQGLGFVKGIGISLDKSGADSYVCDHGDSEKGGIPLYYSAQLKDKGNLSFCQGVGYGYRGEGKVKNFGSGGFGILRDLSGDDIYDACTFTQGSAYWQGVGLLSDGEGSDKYDACWYMQGGSAHYAVAIHADLGLGNDEYNLKRTPYHVGLGSGHDFSVGVFINEAGDEIYGVPNLSAGASNCNGIGLFVDNGGNDLYRSDSDYGSGMGNVSEECKDTRSASRSIGIMIDAGGADVYEYPKSVFPTPANNAKWGHSRNGLASEYGFGIDKEGESGVH